jgi:predicted RNA binding protein YcfA (HicA-like mRNA interferase family)
MTKLPAISGKETVRRLKKAGFVFVRQIGRYLMLRGGEPPVTLSVPNHKELKPGTFRNILRQAGITVKRFNGLK